VSDRQHVTINPVPFYFDMSSEKCSNCRKKDIPCNRPRPTGGKGAGKRAVRACEACRNRKDKCDLASKNDADVRRDKRDKQKASLIARQEVQPRIGQRRSHIAEIGEDQLSFTSSDAGRPRTEGSIISYDSPSKQDWSANQAVKLEFNPQMVYPDNEPTVLKGAASSVGDRGQPYDDWDETTLSLGQVPVGEQGIGTGLIDPFSTNWFDTLGKSANDDVHSYNEVDWSNISFENTMEFSQAQIDAIVDSFNWQDMGQAFVTEQNLNSLHNVPKLSRTSTAESSQVTLDPFELATNLGDTWEMKAWKQELNDAMAQPIDGSLPSWFDSEEVPLDLGMTGSYNSAQIQPVADPSSYSNYSFAVGPGIPTFDGSSQCVSMPASRMVDASTQT
jgi:hypothetical protein